MENPSDNGGPVKITLTVEASSLYTSNPPPGKPSPVIDNACGLKDDNLKHPGSSPTGKIEDFTSQVYIDKKVTWEGDVKDKKVVDKGYAIRIDSIVYESNANDPDDVDFFDETTIYGKPDIGKPGAKNGKVSKKVKDHPNLVGKHDVYRINFSIYPPGNGVVRGPYPIDPKLQGNS